MPRTKKNASQQIADILAKFNIEVDKPIEIPEANYQHNNALAMFAKVPEHFVQGKCMECGLLFAHNQPIPAGTRVGYCSDACRKRAFEKSTGIKWGSVTMGSREPWDGDPPMIITPEQYKNLEKIADWFTRNQTTLEIHDPEPQEQSLEDLPQSPTDQVVSLSEPDFFDEVPTYESESQHQEVSQTIPQNGHAVVMQSLEIEEDDPFDFS